MTLDMIERHLLESTYVISNVTERRWLCPVLETSFRKRRCRSLRRTRLCAAATLTSGYVSCGSKDVLRKLISFTTDLSSAKRTTKKLSYQSFSITGFDRGRGWKQSYDCGQSQHSSRNFSVIFPEFLKGIFNLTVGKFISHAVLLRR